MRISGALPNSPVLETINPGTIPCRANPMSIIGLSLSALMSTLTTAPDLARKSIALILLFARITTSFT